MIRRAIPVMALVTALATPARAADDAPRPRHALSIQPLALLARGFVVQYEHFVLPPRISVATSLGARASASGDYSGFALGHGVEGRFWLTGSFPGSGLARRSMIGPYAYARIDATFTRLAREDGRLAGAATSFAETVGLGVRAPIARFLEVSPSLGVGVETITDRTGRLRPYTTALMRAGVTVGVLF